MFEVEDDRPPIALPSAHECCWGLGHQGKSVYRAEPTCDRRSLRVGRDARTRQPTTTRRYLGSPTPGRRRGVPVLGKVGHHPAPGALPSYFYPSSCSVGDLFLGRRGDRMRHAVPAVSPAPQAPGGSITRHGLHELVVPRGRTITTGFFRSSRSLSYQVCWCRPQHLPLTVIGLTF